MLFGDILSGKSVVSKAKKGMQL